MVETPAVGDNSVPLGVSAKDQLRVFVARLERLAEEKDAIQADIREVFAEAKGNGFDTKALRAVLKLSRQDENKRREEQAVLDVYLSALGMLVLD